jgi:hypothetical protein
MVARRLRADLVELRTAARIGPPPNIVLGSVAEHVMREAPCDVLVARSGSLRFELPKNHVARSSQTLGRVAYSHDLYEV